MVGQTREEKQFNLSEIFRYRQRKEKQKKASKARSKNVGDLSVGDLRCAQPILSPSLFLSPGWLHPS